MEMQDLNQRINALYKEKENAKNIKDVNVRKGKVLGKISLFLDSFSLTKENNTLNNQITDILHEISDLEALIDEEEKESRLSSILNRINLQMSKWKESLDLEYKDDPIRFDIKKLTIFADTSKKSIPLYSMGSGANWVAYHLLVHFAFHKHFILDERPVPRFLILDQPSQVYYPPDKILNNSHSPSESSDEKAVKQMYNFIIEVTKELSPDLQVIVTDHAKINLTSFKDSIIEEWRDGKKLVPEEWYKS